MYLPITVYALILTVFQLNCVEVEGASKLTSPAITRQTPCTDRKKTTLLACCISYSSSAARNEQNPLRSAGKERMTNKRRRGGGAGSRKKNSKKKTLWKKTSHFPESDKGWSLRLGWGKEKRPVHPEVGFEATVSPRKPPHCQG